MHEQFNLQKKTATYLVNNNLFYTILLLPLAVLYFVGCSELLMEATPAYFIVQSAIILFACGFLLFHQFRKIKIKLAFSKVAHLLEDTKDIICTKVSFLTLFDRSRHGFFVAGFIITDAEKKQYYFLFPNERYVAYNYRRFVKSKALGHQLTIKYYAGTNLIMDTPFTLYDYEY